MRKTKQKTNKQNIIFLPWVEGEDDAEPVI